jgi:SprT protein
MQAYNTILLKYLPELAVPTILHWLQEMNVQLKITRKRNTKLGDYRPPFRHHLHRISVNHDLNPYHFLLTLVHELAHVKAYNKYKNHVRPHGKEWKSEFIDLMKSFLNEDIFPDTLLPHVVQYMSNPTSSTSNSELLSHLRNFDPVNNSAILAELPDQSYFSIANGLVFQKLEKIRTRYKCKRMDNQRIYLVNPMIFVDRVDRN